MANTKNNFLPRSSAIDDNDKNNVANLLPAYYRTNANKKFFKSTLTQLTQPGEVNKVSGYIGRQYSKQTLSTDVFVNAPTRDRQNYQLEPGFLIDDDLGNTVFLKDYQDYINQLKVFGANVTNHSRINKQEFYSWNPHIDWDKFVHFQSYYWLPYGPDTITISSAITDPVESTYTVEMKSDSYSFSANGENLNPTLTLYKGYTYYFKINNPGTIFSIKTARVDGTINRYVTSSLKNNAIDVGTIEFTVPDNAPDELFYVNEHDVDFGGAILILDPLTSGSINVEDDIIGKTTYKFGNNISLSNGMKVQFKGNIYPNNYATERYYVEGVGESIQLIPESQLEVITQYTTSESMLFDNTLFDTTPFSDATSYSGNLDYIVINRGSVDKNAWSRNNRWVHKSVIEVSAQVNGLIPTYDQSKKAVRPIIEFEKNLKLFNFGTHAITDVSVIDFFTLDAFSTVEGSLGYIVDGVSLLPGHRVIFAKDTDMLVANNIYRVEFLDLQHSSVGKQIRLVHESTPEYNQTVLVKEGNNSQGCMYWFNGNSWIKGQQKNSVNQAPLFDVFDENGDSFGDTLSYTGSTFNGTTLFSYKVGNGSNDAKLGFPISYKNINNIGDIVFNFTLQTDSFQYEINGKTINRMINNGFLSNRYYGFTNGWIQYSGDVPQAALRLYRNSDQTNNFDIDIYDTLPSDLSIKVYVNDQKVKNWHMISSMNNAELPYYQIIFDTPISESDAVLIKCYSSSPINSKGYYEIPVNLQNNPLNGILTEFTLGEVTDHVSSIIDNLGNVYTDSNLRDLGNVSHYGTKFVQHSGPLSLAIYHITSSENNLIRAIEQSRDDYCKFKRTFMHVAETLGVDLDPIDHVDLILQTMNKDVPVTSPYYFSDMVPTGAKTRTDFTIVDAENTIFSLSEVFSLDTLSNKAVSVYVNNFQLVHGRDYTFSNQGFVNILNLNPGDIVSIFEYKTTDGCLVPETPTKLGMWPKFEPKIFLDSTLVSSKFMIQGHDGSLTLAYDDYRDDLLLELETRIYNNIKIKYDESIFSIHNVIPCYYHPTEYNLKDFNEILSPNFYTWLADTGVDFSTPLTYDINNPFTFNYKNHIAPDGQISPKYWRGIYQWMLGTDRPHICPWEVLGFSEQPSWWASEYGFPPYTCDNLILWGDISVGLVKDPAGSYYRHSYAKPDLLKHIPVDSDGNLVSPNVSGFTSGLIVQAEQGDFTFGDVSPIEAAWRRHSHYAFSVIKTAILMSPAETIGLLFDRSRIKRNLAGQLIYTETGLRIKPKDLIFPSVYLSNTRVQTAGLVNYLINYLNCNTLDQYNRYSQYLKLLTSKLCYRVSGFTSKEKFNLLLDSKSPTTVGSVFIPQEDYNVVLNTSSPIATLTYSGVIITKVQGGYEIKGYSKLQSYFKYYEGQGVGLPINIGGISEGYAIWEAQQTYVAGKIVQYNKRYYRVLITHVSTVEFDTSMFVSLNSLPIVGGITANFKQKWIRKSIKLPYGSKIDSIQGVVDFLLGYGQWLMDQGFIFNDFNTDLRDIANWETSAKEFLFWTTHNWKSMQDVWYEWTPYREIKYGDIVRFNGSYYKSLKTVQVDIFNLSDYELLNGLDIVGTSLIALSPAANKLTFTSVLSVVDNLSNTNNIVEMLDSSGFEITVPMMQLYRSDNAISYQPRTTAGIYCASFYLVQHEHIVVINNSTMFNDTVYNLESGYKQDKIKVSGYVSTNWTGSLNVPGFIVDQAKIREWEPWQNYAVGDIVKYQSFYFSATQTIQGDETFINEHWFKLTEKPTSQLLPNWNYKASQFMDFYSLDSENFDVDQQRMAQHLTGYQKRQYLENIIQDDVSEYKFYQGMILEKGTQNVLNKLFDVLSAEGDASLDFYEEWAIRLGQYGASNAFETVEVVLDESLFKTNPQGYEFVDRLGPYTESIIQQLPTDLYIKPVSYTSNIWPVLESTKTSAIYAKTSDVKVSVKSTIELLSLNILKLSYGDYILCSFVEDSWNVYEVIQSYIEVTSIDKTNNSFKFYINNLSIFTGEVIGLTDSTNSEFNGFFTVTEATSTYFKLTIDNLNTVPTDITNLKVVLLKSRKVQSFNDNSYLFNELLPNRLLWVDNENGQWEVWKYNPVYTKVETDANLFNVNEGRITSNQLGDVVVVSNNSYILIFKLQKTSDANKPVEWIIRQKIDVVSTSVEISKDGKWLAIGNSATGVVKLYKNDTSNYFEFAKSFTRLNQHFGATLTFGDSILFVGTNIGKIYKIEYKPSAMISSYYNPNGSIGNKLVVSNTAGILENMIITGNGFNQGQTVHTVLNSTTLEISGLPTSSPAGLITFSKIEWILDTAFITETNANFVSAAISADNGTLAVLDTDGNSGFGKIYIYSVINNFSQHIATINSTGEIISNLTISDTSEYIAVSRTSDIQIYKRVINDYNLYLTIENPSQTSGIYSLSELKFTNGYSTLIVKSDTSIDVFDIYSNTWRFSERISNIYSYGAGLVVTPSSIIVGPTNDGQSYKVHSYFKPSNTYSWLVDHSSILKPDISKIKQVLLYDRNTNTPVRYLDIIDPIQEKFPDIIDREIKFKTMYDPAIYSIGTSSVNVDDGLAWSTEQVGVLWWDKRTSKFIDNYTDNSVYRNSVWSNLAPGASIDVYEWVETDLLPADWDDIADTEAGLTEGISGKSLYGNSVYSVVSKYDTLSQRFTYTYYYWVKNKSTISIAGRQISAYDASALISNPRGEGYQCITFTSINSFSLVNVKPLLAHKDVVLLIEYWTIDKTDQNIHTQWRLLNNSPTATLPHAIEKKWIDSLCGKDENNRLVPDQKIPVKMRYGIENRPRQSMFVNRFEALKQFIEEVNRLLLPMLVVDDYNLSNLESYDKSPSVIQGLYDTTIDTDAELQYMITKNVVTAKLTPVIVDGKIVDVTIDNSGNGYLVAPYVNIYGAGENAKIRTILGPYGKIVGCEILNAGEGYLPTTVLTVRNFSVLVSSDSQSNGKWSIYSFEPTTNLWSKSVSQAYDTTQYWNTVDWYATGFNQFTTVNHAVETYSDLYKINVQIGQVVKILTTTSNRWVLLKKKADSTSIDWTQSYDKIGSQNGTIQFSSLLYDFIDTPIGFDGMLYDNGVYDNCASVELRIILNAIKNDLFINYRSEYLNLFFASVRYAMSEQTYIDWIFKTSFVNVTHNVGKLRQSVTYKNDNLENFEDYVAEVKPYRTQIRDYVSAYTTLETANSAVTDFDMPAVYNPNLRTVMPVTATVVQGNIIPGDQVIFTSPWNDWYDNVGFSVTSILIVNSGSGYVSEPIVSITSNTGSGATAKAFLLNGKVNRISILTHGSGYIAPPTIKLIGGMSNHGTPAIAFANLGNSVIRTNTVKLKFDRITQQQTITDLDYSEVIASSLITGKRLQFPLKWPPSNKIGSYSVTINGVLEIRDNYTLRIVKTTNLGITSYAGLIEFTTAPIVGSIIKISYQIDSSIQNAVDRIEHYYDPQVGDLGKKLAQLMSGIDYGGVEVSGLNFNIKHGWDSTSYDTIRWDNANSKFNDVKYVYTAGVKSPVVISFPEAGFETPPVGTVLNVYFDADPGNASPIRIDSETYESNSVTVMQSPVTTGKFTEVVIPELFFETYFENKQIEIPAECIFIIREVTSDGTDSNDTDYDVAITGGTFNTSSATGLSPEDIIIDGDKFENNFAGPEEVVPGQVVDTVAIKVYTIVSSTSTTAYMQFKDVLNRVHFKRLPAAKQTTLASTLLSTDSIIILADASNLDQPDPLSNKPGVLEIFGERIEYFTIDGNTVGQLRRGTLGTSIRESYSENTVVQIIGSAETIPYTDTNIIENHSKSTASVYEITESSSLYNAYGKCIVVELSFRPKKSNVLWTGAESKSIVRKGFGQCDEIEVFVGGYDTTEWNSNISYTIDDIVTFGTYTYKCKESHISAVFKDESDKWGLFVGNIRLQKTPYKVYNERLGIEEVFPADFSVNGLYNTVRLSNTFKLAPNTIITVIKRTGATWEAGQTIMNFINAEAGADYISVEKTFDNVNDTFDGSEQF